MPTAPNFFSSEYIRAFVALGLASGTAMIAKEAEAMQSVSCRSPIEAGPFDIGQVFDRAASGIMGKLRWEFEPHSADERVWTRRMHFSIQLATVMSSVVSGFQRFSRQDKCGTNLSFVHAGVIVHSQSEADLRIQYSAVERKCAFSWSFSSTRMGSAWGIITIPFSVSIVEKSVLLRAGTPQNHIHGSEGRIPWVFDSIARDLKRDAANDVEALINQRVSQWLSASEFSGCAVEALRNPWNNVYERGILPICFSDPSTGGPTPFNSARLLQINRELTLLAESDFTFGRAVICNLERAKANRLKKLIENPPAYSTTLDTGDSLWLLAGRAYGDPALWPALASWNGIDLHASSQLSVGRVLFVPRPRDLMHPRGGNMVRPSDSLWQIWTHSKECGSGTRRSWADFLQQARVTNSDLVYPGQIIRACD